MAATDVTKNTLVSKVDAAQKVTYTYLQPKQSTPTVVVVNKTSPPTYTVTPSADDLLGGKTWQTIVAALDAQMLT